MQKIGKNRRHFNEEKSIWQYLVVLNTANWEEQRTFQQRNVYLAISDGAENKKAKGVNL